MSPQTSSYIDVTPSPNKVLTDHPLSTFIKKEEEEEEEEGTSCAVAAAAAAAVAAIAAVKQEVESEAPEPPEVKVEEPEVLTEDVQSDQNKG